LKRVRCQQKNKKPPSGGFFMVVCGIMHLLHKLLIYKDKFQLLRIIAVLGLGGLGTAAMAQGTTIPGISFPVAAGDESMKLLGSVFGGIGDIPGASTVMGSLMRVFNSAILSGASLVGFYLIVSAVVGTAHDGEVLGKRFSSLWVPIRSVTAVSMMVPTASGFSGVQLLVLWLATQGAGLANSLTAVGYEAVLKQGGFTKPYVGSQYKESRDLALSMVPIAACMTANMDAIARAKAGGADVSGISAHIVEKTPTADKFIYSMGFKLKADGGLNECGRVQIAKIVKSANAPIADSQVDSLHESQKQAVTALFNKVQAAVSDGFDKSAYDYATKINAAASEYDLAVTKSLDAAASAVKTLANSEKSKQISDLKSKGWIGLGESYLQMAKYGTAMSASIKRTEVSATMFRPLVATTDYDFVFANYKKIIVSVNESTSASTSTNTGAKDGANESGGDGETGNVFMSKLVEYINPVTNSLVDLFVSAEGENPLLSAKLRGDVILDSAGVTLTAAIAGGAGVGILSGTAGTGILNILTLIAFTLVGIGFTLAVYVPMVPYIIWISVLMAWVVAVAEAVIATPLWMMMHLSGEGDGIAAGGTEGGYKFVAAVFLRPALSVISYFFGAMLLMGIFIFVNESFMRLVGEIQSNTVTGLFLIIGFIGAYAGLSVSIVNKSFALSLSMPSKILHWMGAGLSGDEGIGSDAKTEIEAYAGAVSQGGNRASQRAARGPRGGGGGGVETPETPETPAGGGGGGQQPAPKPKVDAGNGDK